ncbi:MAG: phosphoesterase, partial [Flavobacteriaceae bacterium]|nr:phosphoesterase [Flavobacteriaceae bacterium]
DIESTHDIIEKIREDEKYKIDEDSYIRARLFDMLVGDWDRHQDQWRWAQYDQPNGDKLFKPIPRDRDQVFSNFDGALLNMMRAISGSTKQLQVYDEKLEDIEWMNAAGVKLDRVMVQQSELKTWLTQAEFIMEYVTDDVIERAFQNIPEEIDREGIESIKKKLKGRRENLKDIAERYYKYLNSLVILTGTDKDDYIEVTRASKGRTRVKISRIIDGEKAEVIVDRTFNKELTRDLWIYGLDDDDVFEVTGDEDDLIYTRLIGGLGNDIYRIERGRRVKIYDHESKENTIEKRGGANVKLTDVYNLNVFDYTKNISTKGGFSPLGGSNPDDGILLGLGLSRQRDGFQRNPFSQLHELRALYAFETKGLEVNYTGTFANIFNDWNLELTGRFTSDNYTENFFGFGNETINPDNQEGWDYNRVRLGNVAAGAGILKTADFGSDYLFNVKFESVQVQGNTDRFINEIAPIPDSEFYDNDFFGALGAEYRYHSADNESNPTRGMTFLLNLGGKTNLGETDDLFGYVDTSLRLFNALTLDRKLVLKTDVLYKTRLGDGFLFYQAASLGGDSGLRGYRNERFTGKSALAGSADVRYTFNTIKTKTLPFQLGIFVGGDLGRVWVKDQLSEVWHNDYGGGLWVTAAKTLSGRFDIFTGDEGTRFTVGLGVNF